MQQHGSRGGVAEFVSDGERNIRDRCVPREIAVLRRHLTGTHLPSPLEIATGRLLSEPPRTTQRTNVLFVQNERWRIEGLVQSLLVRIF
jgi:hypothetical protein